jgi:hypothetical protein
MEEVIGSIPTRPVTKKPTAHMRHSQTSCPKAGEINVASLPGLKQSFQPT